MARRPLTGTRIRDRRLDAGMRQVDLAHEAGISPSYLNLIEHNKRRIGGKLLGDLARILNVDPAVLTDGADLALIDQLRTASADCGVDVAEVDRVEELVTRYPGWAAVIDHQSRRIAQLESQMRTMADRMTHDPKLAGALHAVISAVTSIRSTAAILVDDDRLDRNWQQRFHRNIHSDSLRLADESKSLIAYLEAPRADPTSGLSPFEEVSAFLARTAFAIPELEHNPATPIAKVIAAQDVQLSNAARAILSDWLTGYIKRIRQMPCDAFAAEAQARSYDPLALAQHFGVDTGAVLQRLASLDPKAGHPPTGLVTCDAAGIVTFFKPVPGFALPRQGAACPLWPLYQAFSQPRQPIKAEVVLPDSVKTRFLCYAVTHEMPRLSFDQPPVHHATMLVFPDPPENNQTPVEVGITCRICPREGCVARREPSVD